MMIIISLQIKKVRQLFFRSYLPSSQAYSDCDRGCNIALGDHDAMCFSQQASEQKLTAFFFLL